LFVKRKKKQNQQSTYLASANDSMATPHRLIVALMPGSWCRLALGGYLGGQNLHQSCLCKNKKQNNNQAWHPSVMLKSNRTCGIWAKIGTCGIQMDTGCKLAGETNNHTMQREVYSSGCGIGTQWQPCLVALCGTWI